MVEMTTLREKEVYKGEILKKTPSKEFVNLLTQTSDSLLTTGIDLVSLVNMHENNVKNFFDLFLAYLNMKNIEGFKVIQTKDYTKGSVIETKELLCPIDNRQFFRTLMFKFAYLSCRRCSLDENFRVAFFGNVVDQALYYCNEFIENQVLHRITSIAEDHLYHVGTNDTKINEPDYNLKLSLFLNVE